jgi:hypothetical protein
VSTNPSNDPKAGTVTLGSIRDRLTDFQRQLLNEFWEHHLKDGQWPLSRIINSRHGKKAVYDAIRALGGSIFSETGNPESTAQYEITIIGALLTKESEKYREWLINYLEYLRHLYLTDPEKMEVKDEEIASRLKLSTDEFAALDKVISLSRLSSGSSHGSPGWSIRVPNEIEDLPRNGALDHCLESLLFRNFKADAPALLVDRYRQISGSTSTNIFDRLEPKQETSAPIDALKRRYQVFVSSTYEDLKEERQHVMQALLETKCIPTGMELFPATSSSQWELIRRIIDECDYYIVIVAGRYGSTDESGLGYTEREFDYALQIGKPVIAFYHRNIENLTRSKLEKTDVGQQKLATFVEKIKQRVCRAWETPAELGSAVKSAILNELEFNPQPGWVRADLLLTTDTVTKLKQRIADLEEALKDKATMRPRLGEGSVAVEPQFREVKEYDGIGPDRLPKSKLKERFHVKVRNRSNVPVSVDTIGFAAGGKRIPGAFSLVVPEGGTLPHSLQPGESCVAIFWEVRVEKEYLAKIDEVYVETGCGHFFHGKSDSIVRWRDELGL